MNPPSYEQATLEDEMKTYKGEIYYKIHISWSVGDSQIFIQTYNDEGTKIESVSYKAKEVFKDQKILNVSLRMPAPGAAATITKIVNEITEYFQYLTLLNCKIYTSNCWPSSNFHNHIDMTYKKGPKIIFSTSPSIRFIYVPIEWVGSGSGGCTFGSEYVSLYY